MPKDDKRTSWAEERLGAVNIILAACQTFGVPKITARVVNTLTVIDHLGRIERRSTGGHDKDRRKFAD